MMYGTIKTMILEELKKNGPMTATELSERLDLPLRQVTGALKRMNAACTVKKIKGVRYHDSVSWSVYGEPWPSGTHNEGDERDGSDMDIE